MGSELDQRVAAVDVGPSAKWPTLIHVTQAKAGSQWIHRILRGLAPNRVVEVTDESAHLRVPIHSGMIYPTAYVTKDEFDSVVLPPSSRRFVVIRDLRDTLVSHYFSIKIKPPKQPRDRQDASCIAGVQRRRGPAQAVGSSAFRSQREDPTVMAAVRRDVDPL
jgi:hypothetical protein